MKLIDFSCKHDRWIKNSDGSLSRMDEPYFASWKIAEGTWRILSSGDYSYLVEGEDEALAIDSGYGAGNIREYMQTLTTKPVCRIANTHDHFDHTANNSYFEMAYMAGATRELATRPFPSFEGIDFPRDYPVTILGNGDYIPLKGRDIQAFLIPDHAVGSLAFLDRKERILFSGDEFMGNEKVLSHGLKSWEQSLSRLEAVRDQFDIMYGGGFTVNASVIDKLLICTREALAHGGKPLEGDFGMPPMPESELDENGNAIYDRMMPHPEDRKPHDDNREYLRRASYEGCSVIYDIRYIDE